MGLGLVVVAPGDSLDRPPGQGQVHPPILGVLLVPGCTPQAGVRRAHRSTFHFLGLEFSDFFLHLWTLFIMYRETKTQAPNTLLFFFYRYERLVTRTQLEWRFDDVKVAIG